MRVTNDESITTRFTVGACALIDRSVSTVPFTAGSRISLTASAQFCVNGDAVWRT
jgi:hypothetical protein